MRLIYLSRYLINSFYSRASDFKNDMNAWQNNEDGKVVNSQPTRVVDNRNGAGPATGGYVQR